MLLLLTEGRLYSLWLILEWVSKRNPVLLTFFSFTLKSQLYYFPHKTRVTEDNDQCIHKNASRCFVWHKILWIHLQVPTSKAKTTESTKSTIITAENTSTTESQVITDHPFETLPTESTAGDFATLEPTHHSSGNKEPENNENKFSAQKQDKLEDMMIFIVIGVAAVICISVGLLCTWLIISQRRKHR